MTDAARPTLRLQRYLASAGLGSRRQAEELIREGVVRVNGQIATLGMSVDPATDHVSVEGRPVRAVAEKIYVALHKPREVMSTRQDEKGRRTVMDLLPRSLQLVVPVGRLDYHSSGLILMTNDGDLAQALTRPASGVPKVYRVKAAKPLEESQAERFRTGIPLDGRRTRPAELRSLQQQSGFWYEIVLTEGRNRQVRRMFEALGSRVQKLARTAVGPLRLGRLESGHFRPLTQQEVEALQVAAGLRAATPRGARKRGPGWARPKPKHAKPGHGAKRKAPGARDPGSARKSRERSG